MNSTPPPPPPQWQVLYESKPDETLDPEETAAMERAQANLGDYKLKSAADYVVPKHLRVSTESKRRQLVLLRNWVSCGSTCRYSYMYMYMFLVTKCLLCLRFLRKRDPTTQNCLLSETERSRLWARYSIANPHSLCCLHVMYCSV